MIIGIVGGVGCGKSTVLTYLKEKYNAYIIEADKVAKEIMEKGNEVYNDYVSMVSLLEGDSCVCLGGQTHGIWIASVTENL